jgi:Skp family chaperone for outer membrane proteins
MKPIRVFIAVIFLSLLFALSVSAQTQPPRPTATPTPQPQTQPTQQPQTTIAKPAPVPIAFIYAPMFADEKQGIRRLVAALNALDKEFDIPTKELETLSNRAATLTNDIANMQKVPQPNYNEIAKKQDELDRVKREGTYKQENLKAAYAKREREMITPIEEHIYNELRTYVKQFGIKVVLDVNKLRESVVVYSDDADMTKAFIADYNARFPATATPTTPARP